MNNDNDKEKRAGFTPGPWKSELEQKEQLKAVIYPSEGRYPCMQPIAICHASDINERAKKEAQANARLIASAPELYEQCKLFERMLECGFPSNVSAQCNMLAQLREVLAKADGRAEG